MTESFPSAVNRAASFPANHLCEAPSLVGASRKPGILVTSSAGAGEQCLGIETTIKGATIWLALRGEADISNVDNLDTALNGIILNGHQTVRMDLSDLSFIDLTALRRLTNFATHLKENDCEVATQGAPPILQRVIRLLPGPDQLGLA